MIYSFHELNVLVIQRRVHNNAEVILGQNNMPLFGNRMVVATANYKHIKETKIQTEFRENRLGKWVSERKERKEKLKELQVLK